jgi:hypothetical protein
LCLSSLGSKRKKPFPSLDDYLYCSELKPPARLSSLFIFPSSLSPPVQSVVRVRTYCSILQPLSLGKLKKTTPSFTTNLFIVFFLRFFVSCLLKKRAIISLRLVMLLVFSFLFHLLGVIIRPFNHCGFDYFSEERKDFHFYFEFRMEIQNRKNDTK